MGKHRKDGRPKGPVDETERTLVQLLRSLGCGNTQSKKLDFDHKIDALVEIVPGAPEGSPAIGLQISHQRKDGKKTRIFFEVAAKAIEGPLLYAKVVIPVTLSSAEAILAAMQSILARWKKDGPRNYKIVVEPDGSTTWPPV